MSVQAAPALVAGAVPRQPSAAPTMTAQLTSAYTVQRPFYWRGARVEIGATVDLPWPLAVELASAGKVVPVVAVAADPVALRADDPVDDAPAPAPAPTQRAPRRPAPGTTA